MADHGEQLGEHREQSHGFFVYDASVQVPLIVAGPGLTSRVVPDQVRIIDVMPTVLDLIGVPAPAGVQGASLRPVLEGQRQELLAFSETWYPRFHYGWSELQAVRDGAFKFILAPSRELYDVAKDPGEQANLAASDSARADRMERALRALVAQTTRNDAGKGPQAIDAASEQRLRALGYVGSASARRTWRSGRDAIPRTPSRSTTCCSRPDRTRKPAATTRPRRRSSRRSPRIRRCSRALAPRQHPLQGRPSRRRGRGLSKGAGPRPRAPDVDLQPGVGLPRAGRSTRPSSASSGRSSSIRAAAGRHFQLGDIYMQRGEPDQGRWRCSRRAWRWTSIGRPSS